MSPLIEEARRRQRRRRQILLSVVLVLVGTTAAVVGTRQTGPSGGQHRTSSSAMQPLPSGAAMPVIWVQAGSRRARIQADAAAWHLRHGGRAVTVLHVDPKTGKYEVRLTTSH